MGIIKKEKLEKELKEAKAKKEAEIALKRKRKKKEKEPLKKLHEEVASSSAVMSNSEIVEKHLKMNDGQSKKMSSKSLELAVKAKSDLLDNILKIRSAIQHIDNVYLQNDQIDLHRKIFCKKFGDS